MPVQFCSQWQLQITNSRSTPEFEHNTDKDACLSAAALAGFSSRQEPAAFNIYTQLESQMYRNFTHSLPPTHGTCVHIFVCFCLLGEGVWFLTKTDEGGLNYNTNSEISIASFHPGVSGGGRYGWLQLLKSFYCTFFGGRRVKYRVFMFVFVFSGEAGGWNADLWSKLWQLERQAMQWENTADYSELQDKEVLSGMGTDNWHDLVSSSQHTNFVFKRSVSLFLPSTKLQKL